MCSRSFYAAAFAELERLQNLRFLAAASLGGSSLGIGGTRRVGSDGSGSDGEVDLEDDDEGVEGDASLLLTLDKAPSPCCCAFSAWPFDNSSYVGRWIEFGHSMAPASLGGRSVGALYNGRASSSSMGVCCLGRLRDDEDVGGSDNWATPCSDNKAASLSSLFRSLLSLTFFVT